MAPSPIASGVPLGASLTGLQPPSLRHLSIWGILALAFVILTIIGVSAYGIYSCYHTARFRQLAAPPLGRVTFEDHAVNPNSSARARKIRKFKWGSLGSSQAAHESLRTLMLSPGNVSSISLNRDSPHSSPSLSGPPISIRYTRATSQVVAPMPDAHIPSADSETPRTLLTFDRNNIPFYAPQNSTGMTDMRANPKLSPVLGTSGVPMVVAATPILRNDPTMPVNLARSGAVTSANQKTRNNGGLKGLMIR